MNNFLVRIVIDDWFFSHSTLFPIEWKRLFSTHCFSQIDFWNRKGSNQRMASLANVRQWRINRWFFHFSAFRLCNCEIIDDQFEQYHLRRTWISAIFYKERNFRYHFWTFRRDAPSHCRREWLFSQTKIHQREEKPNRMIDFPRNSISALWTDVLQRMVCLFILVLLGLFFLKAEISLAKSSDKRS